MSEKKYILDDGEVNLDEITVEEQFDELIEEKKPEKKVFSIGDVGKGVKNAASSLGSAMEKAGVTADKIGGAADKISKATVKVTKTVSKAGGQLFNTVKNADYKKIAEDVKSKTSNTIETISTKSKEVVEKSKTVITEDQMQSILDACYDKSISGIPGVSKPVDRLVSDYMSKAKSTEQAAKALINNQLVKCTTSGFLTSLGGVITLPVTVPANVASVLYVQMRMIAALAKMGGYDPNDDQVQTLVYACLTGQAVGDVLKSAGVKIGNKLAVSGIKKITGATLTKINRAVGFRLITKFGETGAINLGKMVPVVGGVIGGGFDYVTTKTIAKNAYKAFILDDIS